MGKHEDNGDRLPDHDLDLDPEDDSAWAVYEGEGDFATADNGYEHVEPDDFDSVDEIDEDSEPEVGEDD